MRSVKCETKDTRTKIDSEARDPGDREPVDGLPGLSPSGVACPCNTQLSTRQAVVNGVGQLEVFRNGVAGIDWWQGGACVRWDSAVAQSSFARLEKAKKQAQSSDFPIPVALGNDVLCVARNGQGGGRGSHKEFQLHWKGCVFAFSARQNPSRQHSNASFQVSGSPCLIVGWDDGWSCFHRTIANLGGTLEDEWIQRVDLCLDYPGVSLHEFFGESLQKRHFVSAVRKSRLNLNQDELETFSIGNASRARVVIYDKLVEVRAKNDPLYQKAMITLRWGNRIPDAATRVEFQVGRTWLKQFNLDRTQDISRLNDIFEKLTNGPNSILRLVDSEVDRENRHQGRASTLPAWQAVIDSGHAAFGKGCKPLKRIDRTSLDEQRACKQIVGFATSMADRRQRFCDSVDELLELLRVTFAENGIGDPYVQTKFEDKAKASGTWQDLLSFPGEEAA